MSMFFLRSVELESQAASGSSGTADDEAEEEKGSCSRVMQSYAELLQEPPEAQPKKKRCQELLFFSK